MNRQRPVRGLVMWWGQGLSLCAALLIIGCDRPRQTPFGELTNRQQSELRDCVYVYNETDQLIECLVMRKGWTPAAADRAVSGIESVGKGVGDSVANAEVWRKADSLGTSCYYPKKC